MFPAEQSFHVLPNTKGEGLDLYFKNLLFLYEDIWGFFHGISLLAALPKPHGANSLVSGRIFIFWHSLCGYSQGVLILLLVTVIRSPALVFKMDMENRFTVQYGSKSFKDS